MLLTEYWKVGAELHREEVVDLSFGPELGGELLGGDLDLGWCLHWVVVDHLVLYCSLCKFFSVLIIIL